MLIVTEFLNIGHLKSFLMDKAEILKKFSADPDRYYKVKLFEEQGYQRKSCQKCGRFFWTIDSARNFCPEDSQDTYSFIGNPPTSKRFDYTESWKQVESFFVKNGHTSVPRYPVVCRWRDDLYFTIASVVDFQRIMGSKVVFEFPANPVIVPQMCLRFKDLENVGVTGRHFSSFCMIGQLSIPNSQGYWKDECVNLDFRLLTEQFGIKKDEVVFVEDVWEGGGSFGSSLEYYVRGLELGNAVFTEFQGDLANHTTLDQKVIDMGAGLERFAWMTMGTPTAYDCCFGPVMNHLTEKIGIDVDSDILGKYYMQIAKNENSYPSIREARKKALAELKITDSQLQKIINPLDAAYTIADHLRTLIFAISDGALPSNVGGGYNLRILLRRISKLIDDFKLNLDIDELIDYHIDYLKATYPELETTRDDVKTIIRIESGRISESHARIKKIVRNLREKEVSTETLLTLYESDGVLPEYLQEENIKVPDDFYTRLDDLKQSRKEEKKEEIPLEGLAETDLLFYKDDPMEFNAKVLKTFGNYVVLDRTSFYARGGGQEPDHGTIGGYDVVDVNKHANVVVHALRGGVPKEGETVSCVVDSDRRSRITKHHTSTHILNSSSRNVLGSWVWQNSAFKEEDHARLDITHHSALTEDEIEKIESLANYKVKADMPVTIQSFDRGTAEQKYGFRIYQGGVVPVTQVRIVSIEDFDVEACGGTHVKKTKEIELIKITRTKRIQDGVVRLEFVSGDAAHEYVKQHDIDVKKQAALDIAKEERDKLREQRKLQSQEKIPALLEQVSKISPGQDTVEQIEVHTTDSVRFCCTASDQYDEYFHIHFGERLSKNEPKSIYCGIFEQGDKLRVIVYTGKEIPLTKTARIIAKEVSEVLGGTGGGNERFAQGGGKNKSKKDDAIKKAKSIALE